MEYKKLTEKIIGCAYRVYNKLGFGFLESVYEKCLMIELRKEGMKAESQQAIVVRYDDAVVGEFVADIVVEGTIIVEGSSEKDRQDFPVMFILSSCQKSALLPSRTSSYL